TPPPPATHHPYRLHVRLSQSPIGLLIDTSRCSQTPLESSVISPESVKPRPSPLPYGLLRIRNAPPHLAIWLASTFATTSFTRATRKPLFLPTSLIAGGPKEPIMATPPKRRALEATGEKVLRYEAFISDVLQRDLRKVLDHRDKVYEQLAKYLQLRNVIERLQSRYFAHLRGSGLWFFLGVNTRRSPQVH
uniref:Uncharacterized protein n=1 Tax=Urocitellus parryii TaxID=9999 RepID=A0A8D2KLC6_UROPR